MRVKKRSGNFLRSYSNVKMKGKKCFDLYCGCCVAFNFKWRERWKEALKEIHQDY